MKTNNLSMLEATYTSMQTQGLVKSKAEFSTLWLGQYRSYLTSTKARDRQPPDSVIDHLAERLQWRVDSYDRNLTMSAPHCAALRPHYEAYIRVLVAVQNHQREKLVDAFVNPAEHFKASIQAVVDQMRHREKEEAAKSTSPWTEIFAPRRAGKQGGKGWW